MKWSQFLKDYLSFSRKDRIGVLVLIALILFIFLIPGMIRVNKLPMDVAEDSAWINKIMLLEEKSGTEENQKKSYKGYTYQNQNREKDQEINLELFYFDPNTISAADWARLGIREKTIGTIQKYLSKGGKFRSPEDLKKVYGIRASDFERLLPYIKIKTAEIQNKKDSVKTSYSRPVRPVISPVDINTADTSAFISLPGIGSKLASRIILFREKLGGFYSIEQVKETFGLQDSVFQKIKEYLKLESISIKKININAVTLDELKSHPYFRTIAKAVIAYRETHGLFRNINELLKVAAISPAIFQKARPYLTDN